MKKSKLCKVEFKLELFIHGEKKYMNTWGEKKKKKKKKRINKKLRT